jgi:hypothetical protein
VATKPEHSADLVRECKDSLRADFRHGWVFDGDDPYVYCVYCGELRDAHTGKVIG